ncbi:hypothetical protein HJG60_008472 [Phyllostomus discolor]|uniref:Uncharacterized protein n=1 Tax=Phyllostomus discolor TaxID=89673 RepID=A0A833Z1M3_9CHIR|nr:hypothetical protein HJG60_008472 [Phyllostomus discolor]
MSERGVSAEVPRGGTAGHLGRERKVRLSVFLHLHPRSGASKFLWSWGSVKGHQDTPYAQVVQARVPFEGRKTSNWAALKMQTPRNIFFFQIHLETQSRFSPAASAFLCFTPRSFQREKKVWLLWWNAVSRCPKLERCSVWLLFPPFCLVFWFILNLVLSKGFSVS